MAARANLLPWHPRLHLVGRHSRARVHPEVDRVGDAFDDPRVASVLAEPFHSRHATLEAPLHATGPEVRRFVDVLICGDDAIPASLVRSGHWPSSALYGLMVMWSTGPSVSSP